MVGITKAEREKRTKEKEELRSLLESRGLHSVPTCKVCRKSPDKIKEYENESNPILFVLKNERLTRDGRFYCTTCYLKAGMPLF